MTSFYLTMNRFIISLTCNADYTKYIPEIKEFRKFYTIGDIEDYLKDSNQCMNEHNLKLPL